VPLRGEDRERRLSVVNDVMARYRFTPITSEEDSWVDLRERPNTAAVQGRHFVSEASGARKSCTAILSLTSEHLRVSLQGSGCSTRASVIAQSLRMRWQADSSAL